MLVNIHLCRWCALFAVLILSSCDRSDPKSRRPTFKEVEGIKFIEVRREFDTGLSFNEHGFQQVPEWTLYFLPGDSVKIYSPFEKKYIFYPIYFDHDQVINFAREWLRLKHVSQDSLVLQLLRVQSKVVNQELSKVYMRFYSEDYIKNVLNANPDSLRRPNRRDTLFIKKMIQRANSNPKKPDSMFAARNPVQFKSKINEIGVTKRKSSKDDINYSASDEYLYPEYDISIRNSYKDFAKSFTVIVDKNGDMAVGRFAVIEEDFEAPQRKILQAIVDVYLEHYLQVIPGTTLGMPHATEIMLHVKGTKD